MATGILRIQAFAARQSAPVEGVTVNIVGDGFTAARMTDAEGNAADVTLTAPDCALSLEEDNTTRLPYAVCSLTASKAGYRTVRIQGIQVFAGQVTLAQPEMIPETEEDRDVENPPIVIPPHPLFAGGGGSGRAPADPCAPRVLDRVIIPKNITVHLGKPAASARNVTVSFRRYIANVASSEVYPTWPESALRANIHCQISLALNRIYTEWYPSRGYSFNITNSTSYDQYYVHGRTVFDVMVRLTDDIFNTYIRKTGTVNPYYAEYCDGKSVTCPGLKQWGTVTLANQGRNALSILKYYYGNNIEIIRTNNIQSIPQSYPGSPLRQGSTGAAVFTLQRQLNRITKDYPFLGLLTVDGIVGRTTWTELYDQFRSIQSDNGTPNAYPGTALREGASGQNVRLVQFWLKIARTVYSSLNNITVDGIFGSSTAAAVRRFQTYFGLTSDGVVGRTTWNKLYEVYNDIANRLLSPSLRPGEYPGVLRNGSTGTAVRELQFYLYLMSAYQSSIPSVSIDGRFGAATEAAVRAYQRFAGLTVDGIVGRKTWDSLYGKASALRSSGPVVTLKRLPYPGTPLTVGTDSSAVLYYTLLLQRIAYYYDSVASPALSRQYTQETADATASAQELLGLPATGVADAETWTAVEALSLQLAAFTPNPDRHPEQGPDYPDRAMKEGSAGPDVRLIEGWLNGRAQLYCEEDYVADNAVFGPEDTAAVKETQQRAGLEANGVVDRPTWAALRAQSHTACDCDNCTEEG